MFCSRSGMARVGFLLRFVVVITVCGGLWMLVVGRLVGSVMASVGMAAFGCVRRCTQRAGGDGIAWVD